MCLPTPEGPTRIKGLYCWGDGLKGWKYSFAYTKTSFYRLIVVEAYRLMQKDGRDEVVEHFSDFRVLHLVLGVRRNQLVFACAEVGQHLVVKVHVLLHAASFN